MLLKNLTSALCRMSWIKELKRGMEDTKKSKKENRYEFDQAEIKCTRSKK